MHAMFILCVYWAVRLVLLNPYSAIVCCVVFVGIVVCFPCSVICFVVSVGFWLSVAILCLRMFALYVFITASVMTCMIVALFWSADMSVIQHAWNIFRTWFV